MSGVTVARQRTGCLAEGIVAERLRAAGWVIVARNARTSEVRGELDLVALDGRELVFVEVKARRVGSLTGPETPASAVAARKQAKLRSLAIAWLRDRGRDVPAHDGLRFDVVGVRLDARGRPLDYEHLRAAF